MHQGGLQWCAVFIADFGLFLHHISSDSNPGLTLKEPSRLRDRDVLRSCLYHSIATMRRFCWVTIMHLAVRSFSIIHLRCIREVFSDALSSLPISGYFYIISAPTVTPAWLWKSQAASVIATCYARASTIQSLRWGVFAGLLLCIWP